MDHATAIALQAAEKYCAGDLAELERDAFEEHFFECAECAEEVRWEQIFRANARVAFEQEVREPRFVRVVPVRGGETIEARQEEIFVVLSVPRTLETSRYTCEIFDAEGGRIAKTDIGKPPVPWGELTVALPVGRFDPGVYTVAIEAWAEIARITLKVI